MSRLSACYFCGTALDEPLAEVALDPDAADPPVVTLCPACREKLETVIEALPAGDPTPTSAAAEPASAAADPASPADDGQAPARDDGSASGAGVDPTGGESGDSAPAATPGAGESATDAAGADEGGDGERSIVEGEQEISALEYNKVMRLLQNREFPVDREEIVAVAANAYEVSRRDCARVIDVAIDRGLLAEDDRGRLVRPD